VRILLDKCYYCFTKIFWNIFCIVYKLMGAGLEIGKLWLGVRLFLLYFYHIFDMLSLIMSIGILTDLCFHIMMKVMKLIIFCNLRLKFNFELISETLQCKTIIGNIGNILTIIRRLTLYNLLMIFIWAKVDWMRTNQPIYKCKSKSIYNCIFLHYF
jgi:hypothetical protein